ncbi:MAG: prolipoprotein diacylglyceryl transferase, partial [Clostridia bacterium]|nr:prolipoprotein diacylglyceryl transferase [Clostridia bacterium]
MRSPDFEIAFSIGKFHVYWYAILLAVGIAVAMFVMDLRSKGRSVPKDIALDLCILGMPFGALGARLFACLCHEVAWKDFFDLTRPGLSFFGGLIFAAAAILVYLGLRKVSLGEMTDIAAPGVFAGLGIAVWGDFFNRSHYGPLVEKSGLKWFPLATIGDDLAIHYAAFFYEFLLCVVLIVLYYALFRRKIRRVGARFPLMALLFCLGRFVIDAIRMDKVMVGPIAFDQIWELVI